MTKLLRYQDLVDRGIVRNRTTLWRWQKIGFPKGILIGPNSRAFTQESIDRWLAERAAAQPTEAS
jgi:predicted DNA-binding transcriptional regulator AlpA